MRQAIYSDSISEKCNNLGMTVEGGASEEMQELSKPDNVTVHPEERKKISIQKLKRIGKKEQAIVEKTYCHYCKKAYLKNNFDRHCRSYRHRRNINKSKDGSQQIISDKREIVID